MRRLLKTLLLLSAAMAVARLTATVVSRQFEEGSEVSDEFRRVRCMDGLDFTSRAAGLRRARVSVVLGGANGKKAVKLYRVNWRTDQRCNDTS